MPGNRLIETGWSGSGLADGKVLQKRRWLLAQGTRRKPGWPVDNAILKAVENFFSSLLGNKAIIAPKVVGHEMSDKFVQVAK